MLRVVGLGALCLFALSCAQGVGPRFEAIRPTRVAVNETLRLSLGISNGRASQVLAFRGPDVAGLDRTASISGNGLGGEFRWGPLTSHVGTHEFVFLLLDGDDTVAQQAAVIDVVPSADSAPVFLRPGAGGTYDLERDPCVSFDVEVRDDDTLDVDIRARSYLPDRATLTPESGKRARFDWCPTPDQVATAQRWNIELEADDRSHPATAHDYVAVLRTGPKEGCPGLAPEVSILSPSEGTTVAAEPGYTVLIDVLDDMGLRDAPLLYYSTTAPEDPSRPDITLFEQVTFAQDGSQWRARVPPLGLADGATATVYIVASATDNDDAMGALCDHQTDSALRTFTAVGGAGSGGIRRCDSCSASFECASGVCGASATGGRCLDHCDDTMGCSAGSCGSQVTREGGIARACGDVGTVCGGGGGDCLDDSREENDSIAAAGAAPTSFTDGQICPNDPDFFRIPIGSGTQVTVTIDGFRHTDGDLDLRLLGSSGTILASSAGITDSESVSQCVAETGAVYAQVLGYAGARNNYSMRVTTSSGSCCTDDLGEDDDTRLDARLVIGTDFDGTVCPGDDDYLRFSVPGPSRIDADIVFDEGIADLDLELYGPTGMLVGSSRGVSGIESISRDVTESGSYVLRVYGFRDASADYLGTVTTSGRSGCTSTTLDCPAGQVCGTGSCVSDSCTSSSSCPSGHECPTAGPAGTPKHCGVSCFYNSDCRSSEACKWYPEGRYCGARGSRANGDACSSAADCGGQRACMPYSGGYCARAGCYTNADCETGTWCVTVSGVGICALDCLPSDDICRLSGGYDCGLEYDSESRLQFVCVPR